MLNPELRGRALGSKDEVDAEAYDRFCNKQDRAYSVHGGIIMSFFIRTKMLLCSEIYDFVESAGLNFVSFNSRKERLKYEIENTEMEDDLKEEIMKFNKREQQAIAELVDGSIIGHTFFVSKKKNPKAALQDK